MSEEHVSTMNARLAASEEAISAAAALGRPYVIAHELHDGPDGETVHWQLRFDSAGVRFALTPVENADVHFRGDWRSVLVATAQRSPSATEPSSWLTVEGDFDAVMAAIGGAFAVAHKAAVVPVTFPVGAS